MPVIEIRGISIDFPFEPYEIQKDYMEKIIECLQTGSNGVLESPTGTGKTLSLLCSSLAWLCIRKASFQMKSQPTMVENNGEFLDNLRQQLSDQSGNDNWGAMTALLKPPKVIYASRTHAQLGQVMLELKKTAYKHVKVGVLGSRDQLCIHPQVSKETNVATKANMCKMMVASRSCNFYLNVEHRVKDAIFQEDRLVDIEDLIRKGKKTNCCPYYASRELQNEADILFAPYNYLLDTKTRKSQDMKLYGDVVILDEGHNVEKVCEEASSSELTSSNLAVCIGEITDVMRLFHEDSKRDYASVDAALPTDFNAEDLCILKAMFMLLEKSVDALQLETNDGKKSKTFDGAHIFTILETAQITHSKVASLLEILYKVSQYLMTISESQLHRKGSGLLKFIDFLEVVFNSLGRNHSKSNTNAYYKLYVEPEMPKIFKGGANPWSAPAATTSSSNGKILNFWCFSPGFGMKSLSDQGVHCIVLTSGTLSPLAATISEIGIPVKVQLSNPHIIKRDQICALVVEKGPGNNELKCVYQNRSNDAYLADLGGTFLNLFRVIPGGILVFFPSYTFLTTCLERWQENGTWDKITAVKSIFVEPKSKDSLKAIVDEYSKAIEGRNGGAGLLAVCRGKVSEGMDFADGLARAVVVVGLPYPPFNDPRVALKRQHLDKARRESQSSCLDGSQWYQLEAMRAVNQAVGRVIRHAGDHGVVLLCDCRFSYPNNGKSLSAWMQPYVVSHSAFGRVVKSVRDFFRIWGEEAKPSSLLQTSRDDDIRSNGCGSGSVPSSIRGENEAVREFGADEDCSGERRRCLEGDAEGKQLAKLYRGMEPAQKKCVERARGLQDLDNYEAQGRIAEKSYFKEISIFSDKISVENMYKKRKLTIVSDPSKSTVPEKFNVTKYVAILQQKFTSEEMDEFKLALANYSMEMNYEPFIATITKLFFSSTNQLHSQYKDIHYTPPYGVCISRLFPEVPHFLRTTEHKEKFWKNYISRKF